MTHSPHDSVETVRSFLLRRCIGPRLSPLHPFRSQSGTRLSWAVGIATFGYFAFSPLTLAHDGDHMSRQHNPVPPSQHEWHYRDPFWGGWSSGYAGNYDSNYYYAPTQAQATTAQTRVKDYLNAVRKGRRRAATHRYIAVETLKPTKNQLEDYKKKQADAKSAAAAGGTQLSNRWVQPSQLRCVMVFDTQSKQFVGSGCYVIGSLPPAGTIAKFDTFSAEFVGTPKL